MPGGVAGVYKFGGAPASGSDGFVTDLLGGYLKLTEADIGEEIKQSIWFLAGAAANGSLIEVIKTEDAPE